MPEMPVDLSEECVNCIHKGPEMLCEAFPYGIPEEIANGTVSHRTPYPGDTGILYEPAE